MAKKHKKSDEKRSQKNAKSQHDVGSRSAAPAPAPGDAAAEGPRPKMKAKAYEAEMRILQGELVAMQEWVKATGAKVCVVFEGLDSAGKGGTIRRITERTSPRVFKHIALPDADRAREVADVRPALHRPLPGGGRGRDLRPQLVQPRRRRAGAWGSALLSRRERFLDMVPAVEKAMVDSGIILIKYWLNVSVEEQARRLESRIDDPRKIWKLSPTDLKSYSRRYDYCRARDAMLAATDTSWAPWFVAQNDDKKRGRLNIISHLLDRIPYEPVPAAAVKLPEQPSDDGYVEPDLPLHLVPEKF